MVFFVLGLSFAVFRGGRAADLSEAADECRHRVKANRQGGVGDRMPLQDHLLAFQNAALEDIVRHGDVKMLFE